VCGVNSLNGRKFAAGTVPGPVTRRLTEAFKELVGCDFVAQYLRHLES
jgi:branched-chain amino acid aminotransferase